MFRFRIRAVAPLLAPILFMLAPQAFAAPEPNTVLEATGEGLSYLDVRLTSKGYEPQQLRFSAEDGRLVGDLALPREGNTDFEITAFNTEGKATHSGKGSIPPSTAIDKPVLLGLPPMDEGARGGLVVSLSHERLVLEAFESNELNRYTIDLQVLDPIGNPAKFDPNDIRWGLTDPTHFELLPLEDKYQIALVPKDIFPKPFKFCDVPPEVQVCTKSGFCKAIKVCPDPYVQISAATSHTCALKKSGAALCWGSNHQGQLGSTSTNACNSTTQVGSTCSTRPRRVECPAGAPCRFKHIAAGVTLTVAIDTNGDAWWWGRGSPVHNKVTATLAGSPVGFFMGAAGFGHGCAISSSRSEVWCWGANVHGESGAPPSPTEVSHTAPVRVLVPMKFKKIVAGSEHTCGIGSGGYDIVCWGRDDENQTRGPNSTQVGQFFFQQFGGLTSILDVAASPNSTCVTLGYTNGVRCWGANANRNVTPFGQPEHLTVGFAHICATTSAQASCVGSNNWGELGNGSWTHQAVPGPVKAPPPLYSNISAGDSHTCGLTPDGDVFCWGNNLSGQAGTGAATYSVKDPTKVVTP